MPCSAACCAICAPMVPAPTTSRRPSALPSFFAGLIPSGLVRPPDRNPSGAVGQLLRRLGVPDDGHHVALQLEAAQHDPLGGVELLRGDLLPARVGAGDDELGLLGIV